jgi:cobyrinic acid a,c-diamide synthase
MAQSVTSRMRRGAQELINKGIDPYSEAGQKAFRQKEMSQSDQMSKAAFDALGFGAGLQEQMFGQDAQRSQLAQALLQAQMGLSQRGHEFDTGTLLGADQQSFGQMLGLEGLNYRDYLTSDSHRVRHTVRSTPACRVQSMLNTGSRLTGTATYTNEE